MKLQTRKKECLGTVVEMTLPHHFSHFFPICFQELQRIETTYSRFLDDSELSVVNAKLNQWVSVSKEFFSLVQQSLSIKEQTSGFFDITLKEELEAMGYDKDYSLKPKEVKKSIKKRVQEKIQIPIKINEEKSEIYLSKQIDFGGLGKGFALDRLKTLCEEEKIDHFYINAGGDIYAQQAKEQKPWTILLEHPLDNKKALGHLDLSGQAIASSSPSKRSWGKFHHLLNPRTKKPANDMLSVFVLAKQGILADAYATALFTAGFETAQQLLPTLECEALLVSAQKKVFTTPQFNAEFYT